MDGDNEVVAVLRRSPVSKECSRKQTFAQQAFILTGAEAAGAEVVAQFLYLGLERSVSVVTDLSPTS